MPQPALRASTIKTQTPTMPPILARPTVEDIEVTTKAMGAIVDSPALVTQITATVLHHGVVVTLEASHEAAQTPGVEDLLIALVRRMAHHHHQAPHLPRQQKIRIPRAQTILAMSSSVQGKRPDQKMATRITSRRPAILRLHPQVHTYPTLQRRAKEARLASRLKRRPHRHQLRNQSLI